MFCPAPGKAARDRLLKVPAAARPNRCSWQRLWKLQPRKDETLTNLIDDALKEIEAHPRTSKKDSRGGPKSSGAYKFEDQPTLPKWFWLVLGGMVLLAVIVGFLLAMTKGG